MCSSQLPRIAQLNGRSSCHKTISCNMQWWLLCAGRLWLLPEGFLYRLGWAWEPVATRARALAQLQPCANGPTYHPLDTRSQQHCLGDNVFEMSDSRHGQLEHVSWRPENRDHFYSIFRAVSRHPKSGIKVVFKWSPVQIVEDHFNITFIAVLGRHPT